MTIEISPKPTPEGLRQVTKYISSDLVSCQDAAFFSRHLREGQIVEVFAGQKILFTTTLYDRNNTFLSAAVSEVRGNGPKKGGFIDKKEVKAGQTRQTGDEGCAGFTVTGK